MLPSANLHNFPAQPTSFVGREADIDELRALLNNPACRLVTLVGAGGTGKTRLSLETGAKIEDAFANGVYFVPLAHLSRDEDIVTTIIRVLGIQTSDSDDLSDELCKFLSQQQLLLILDNFEHITDGAGLLSHILSQAPHVKMLITSRGVLHLQEEWIWQVDGLPFPQDATVTDIENYSAIRLFLDRAQRVQINAPAEVDMACVVHICQMVAGIPLALELAASWLNTLTCQEIATEIQNNIDLLATQMRNVPERHRSIRAVFDHSWHLCCEDEQIALRRLSIFRSGFERDAAHNVAGVSLQTLAALVEKSMLMKRPSGRYSIHELIRHYAEEKLDEAGETDAVQTAHMQYFANFMAERTLDIMGREQLAGLNKIDADYDNIRTAWHRVIETQADAFLDQMMEGLVLFYEMYSRFQEGDTLFQQAMHNRIIVTHAELSPVLNRLRLSRLRVWLLLERYPIPDAAQTLLTETLQTAQQQGDESTVAWCLWAQGEFGRKTFYRQHHVCTIEEKTTLIERIKQDYHDAIAIFARFNQSYAIGRQLRGLAWLHMQFDNDDFETYNNRLIQLAREMGDKTGMAHALVYAAIYKECHEDLTQSDKLLEEAVTIWEQMGDQKSLSYALQYLALHALLRGDFARVREDTQRLMNLGKHINLAYLTWHSNALLAFVRLIEGDYDYARTHFLASKHEHKKDVYKLADITLCLSAVAFNQYDEATEILQRSLSALMNDFVYLEAIQWVVASALIVAHRNDPTHALELLALAKRQARATTGWMAHYAPIATLQARLKQELDEPTYNTIVARGEKSDLKATVMALHAMFNVLDGEDYTSQTVHQSLVEPLTERELDVLRLMVAGLSNRDIAEELTLAIGTVKTHAHNLYSKLDVSNRTEAAAVAHELNLV
jgi:predicted ATPase/DNA-binding CsgD family transcriptional regulator